MLQSCGMPLAGRAHEDATFVDVLRRRGQDEPDTLAFVFEGDAGAASLRYGELDARARALAAALQAAGAPGDHVLLLFPPGLDYVTALFGCLYAGAVAVPAYPPDPARLDRTLPRLSAIMRDAAVRTVLTTRAVRDALAERLTFADLQCVVTDERLGAAADDWQPPRLGRHEVALLQYTSGSTASPRGVLLTHANLQHNSVAIKRAFGLSRRSRAVVWLPPYHDMGLVGGLLQPVYTGFVSVLMSPLTFLRRPLRWLRAVAEHRATVSGGPNFAFDLCVRRVNAKNAATLDLSSWQVAFSGSEPVRPETINAFSRHFEAAGFRREAFLPCYGLAEATLMVTGGPVPRRVRVSRPRGPAAPAVVGCGAPARGHRVEIVDPATCNPLPEGRAGEVWVAGPSIGQGYFGAPEATATVFGATIAGTQGSRFLRTGDLGFLRDGELFVTGRIKDVLVVAGRNHSPVDIERACEQANPGLRPGCGAAFTYERGGRTQVGVAYEVSEGCDHDAAVTAIRQAVARVVGVQVSSVVLTRPRTIPKTSSGKVQRSRCASLLLDGSVDVVAHWSIGSLPDRSRWLSRPGSG
jgi:acyl-CoA synthetase (AMP-forming)/AMP-acid ligase II